MSNRAVTVTSMTKLMTVEASRVHGAAAECSTVAQVSAVLEFNGGDEFLPCGARRHNDGGEELGIKRGEGKGAHAFYLYPVRAGDWVSSRPRILRRRNRAAVFHGRRAELMDVWN
jgi:hypothetical protein